MCGPLVQELYCPTGAPARRQGTALRRESYTNVGMDPQDGLADPPRDTPPPGPLPSNPAADQIQASTATTGHPSMTPLMAGGGRA